ncbi:unnamed protein product [Mytilus edulis]|uniref:Uncharacterized protein n=1 Tax=Mytilus edulis TaxID=6550 RepID=A0A8S3R7L1_MYTED|nr:unnamed protein product [Mytilus edulis]
MPDERRGKFNNSDRYYRRILKRYVIKESTNRDKLEQEIEKNIKAAEQKSTSQIDRLLSKIANHDKSLDELQKNISATKIFATDLQTFWDVKGLNPRSKKKKNEIPVSQQPLEVTCIDEKTVAVTHNAQPHHIEIVNIENKKITNKIKTSKPCYGITINNGRLVYYEWGSGIQTVDVTDGSIVTTVVKIDGDDYWNYVTRSRDKMYLTNHHSSTVTCYTVTGQKVWKY